MKSESEVVQLYPRNYQKDRAPRIVLGADKENQPMLIWFEGAGKFGYVQGKESPPILYFLSPS